MKFSFATLFSLCFAMLLFNLTVEATEEHQVTKGGDGGWSCGRIVFGQAELRIQLRGGSRLDGMNFFGVRFGEDGGKLTDILTVAEDEYITSFTIRGADEVDFLSLTTNTGQTIAAGGNGGRCQSTR